MKTEINCLDSLIMKGDFAGCFEVISEYQMQLSPFFICGKKEQMCEEKFRDIKRLVNEGPHVDKEASQSLKYWQNLFVLIDDLKFILSDDRFKELYTDLKKGILFDAIPSSLKSEESQLIVNLLKEEVFQFSGVEEVVNNLSMLSSRIIDDVLKMDIHYPIKLLIKNIMGYVEDYVIIDKNSGVVELDVESLVLKLHESYADKKLQYWKFYFTVGVNHFFLPRNFITIEDSSKHLHSLAYVSEKNWFQIENMGF